MQIFGKARYDYLVNMCDEMGIVTPEHPFPVWTDEGGPATIVPMFLLYDYTFLPEGTATKAEGLAVARETQRRRHRRVPPVGGAIRHPRRVVPRSGEADPREARRPRLVDADRSWSTTSRWCANRVTRCSIPSSRCGAAPPRPTTGTPATTRCARSTATCTSRAPPGTTACGSRRCRSVIRESGGGASPIGGCGRSCPTRSTRPATLTSSAGTSRSRRRCGRNAEKMQERIRSRRA